MGSLLKRAKKRYFFTLTFGLMLAGFAETMSVTVSCNGQPVPNLSITVTDSLGQILPDIQPTNNQGIFQIENSENYVAPFYIWFTNKQGSTCGSYYIFLDSVNTGTVQLDYYPVELPCSCSKLIQ